MFLRCTAYKICILQMICVLSFLPYKFHRGRIITALPSLIGSNYSCTLYHILSITVMSELISSTLDYELNTLPKPTSTSENTSVECPDAERVTSMFKVPLDEGEVIANPCADDNGPDTVTMKNETLKESHYP